MPSQQLNYCQQIQASLQQQNLILKQLEKFHQNLCNRILQYQIQNQPYEQQAKIPQIFIHEVESLCSQQAIQQKDQGDQIIFAKQYSPVQYFKSSQPQDQQNGEVYKIKISKVQSIKSLQESQMNDSYNFKTHLMVQNDQYQQNLQTNQKKNQQCNQKKQIVKNNKVQQKTKQNKTYFQTRYHQRVSSNRKSYQTRKDETIQKDKSTLKQSKQKNFRKSKQNSSSTQFKKINVLNNLNLNAKSQTMLSNLKEQHKMPLLILNKSKVKQILALKPQISLNGPVQKMKDILQDRNYNNVCENQKENKGYISKKIIKRSPYGLLEIIVKKQKRQSHLSKITNLRILKPGQLKKINKKSRIQLLGKSCDAKAQQFDQFSIKKEGKQQKIIDNQLLSPSFLKF